MKTNTSLQLRPFDLSSVNLVETLTTIWNQATTPGLSVSTRHFEFNSIPFTGVISEGRVVYFQDMPIGFVAASAMPDHPMGGKTGWIDAIAVLPEYRNRGAGSLLCSWAEDWLIEEGCKVISLGASPHTMMPGFPEELGDPSFFVERGFSLDKENAFMWDVARDLGDGEPISRHPFPQPNPVRQAAPGDEDALLEFLKREFPGGWLYEFQEFMKIGGDIRDYFIVCLDGKVEGFAWITLEHSARPLDRFHHGDLPRPWGQLGPIGVSEGVRKYGYGGLVLQAGLEYLRSQGVRGCIIDWTGIIGFYGKYGFKPYRKYYAMAKNLA